ncbi:MAG: 4-hydroxy-tetrahydrodipicolinate reductase [Spirochaetaceae bacterium]|nr:4-hydroxy-tetrahydrodipicolinate reductase [Spirochaetaceae bacterium]
MKVLLVGYGFMGKEIEKIVLSRGHTIAGTVDPVSEANHKEITPAILEKADVVIDFSTPSSVEKNCDVYVKGKTPIVMGTTGWENIREQIGKKIDEAGIGFIWGSNFSVGANLFVNFVGKATALINKFPEYDILLHEYHHKRKKDSPSGTALMTAEEIINKSDKKSAIVTERLDRQIKADELHVSSTRGGDIPGTHIVMFDSVADTIELTHRARNRGGFALGSVIAAEWIINKKGFIKVEDFFKELLK